MKFTILLSLIALTAAYTTLDDTVDFKALVANRPELLKFIYCLLDRVPCDNWAVGYRKEVGVAIVNQCKECTDYQKFTLYTFLMGMQSTFPEEYEHFRTKYDPDDIYLQRTTNEVYKYKNYE